MSVEMQAQNWKTVVKIHLLKRDLSITDLAKAIGYPRNSVSIAINYEDRLPGVKRKITEYLNI